MTVIAQLVRHYSTPGNIHYSVKELLALHGKKWLDDSNQMEQFEYTFCICRDGIVRLRYGLYSSRD